MTTRRTYPPRRQDGGFSVELDFQQAKRVELEDVRRWTEDWSARNREWVRQWRGAQTVNELLRFSDAFLCAPLVQTSKHKGCIVIRLEASSEAVFWKDWMAKFVREIRDAYPSLELPQVTTHP